MSEIDVIRLFVAVPVPEGIKNKLHGLQQELQSVLPKTSIRWTPLEQIHLTLRFFGNVRREELEDLKRALQNACEQTRVLRLQAIGFGLFPEKRSPRVIWIGVQDSENQIAMLHGRITKATARYGEKPEDRQFSAHLTVGRVKEIRRNEERLLREFIESRAHVDYGEWEASDIQLIGSELGSVGARHSVVSTYELPHLP